MRRVAPARSLQYFRIAALNLTRHRRRTLLALAIICGGVVSFLLAGGFINWVLWGMREGVIHAQLGHVQITAPDYFRSGLSEPYKHLLRGDPSIIASSEGAAVVTVAPRLAFTGIVSKGDMTISFLGEGVDPVAETPLNAGILLTAGGPLIDRDEPTAFVGEGLAANIDARPGDLLVLMVTTASGGINAVEVRLAGTFATPVKAYDDSVIRIPLEVARRLMRVEGATSWVVLLDNTDKTDQVVSSLRARLPGGRYEIVPWYELADFYNKTAELFGRQVNAVLLLITAIVVLSISNTLSMAVIERTTEIGTSLALGVRRAGILALFVCEGIVLGVVAGRLGVGIALAFGELISWIGIPMPPPPGMSRGYTGRIDISSALALEGFALAFVATVLASLAPAWKASRMNIVDALRHSA